MGFDQFLIVARAQAGIPLLPLLQRVERQRDLRFRGGDGMGIRVIGEAEWAQIVAEA
jgi:hypothetical protein